MKPEDLFEVDYDRDVETKSPTTSVTQRKSKIQKSSSQMSTNQGRQRNDPLYKRMIYYRELYFRYREMLHKKYRPGVGARARR